MIAKGINIAVPARLSALMVIDGRLEHTGYSRLIKRKGVVPRRSRTVSSGIATSTVNSEA